MQNHMPDFFNIIGHRTEIAAQEKIIVAQLGSDAGNSAAAVDRLTILFHHRNRFSGFFLTVL